MFKIKLQMIDENGGVSFKGFLANAYKVKYSQFVDDQPQFSIVEKIKFYAHKGKVEIKPGEIELEISDKEKTTKNCNYHEKESEYGEESSGEWKHKDEEKRVIRFWLNGEEYTSLQLKEIANSAEIIFDKFGG